ncbi:transposase [Gelria sp. Kuro-4]|uniref:transposase n=1 Tax=Gelria sp. Kuro-4 TaxID=2796927 RepID=UPI00351D3CBE
MIDGVVVAQHTVVVALGIAANGKAHPWAVGGRHGKQGRLPGAAGGHRGKGIQSNEGILVVIDGSKALAAAVKDAFGDRAFIQRCRVHKKRNVMEHLPEGEQSWAARKLDLSQREEMAAWGTNPSLDGGGLPGGRTGHSPHQGIPGAGRHGEGDAEGTLPRTIHGRRKRPSRKSKNGTTPTVISGRFSSHGSNCCIAVRAVPGFKHTHRCVAWLGFTDCCIGY